MVLLVGGSDFCVGFVKLLALFAVVVVLLLFVLLLKRVAFAVVAPALFVFGLKLENAVVGDRSERVGATLAMGALTGAGLR